MPHRVLVVDDEDAIRDLLREYLEGLGYEVAVAADGVEGISVYATAKPDLAIVDFLLPKKNGFAVADAIRKSDRPHTPILMMSGVFKNPKTAVEAKEKYQVIDFLSKPLDLEALANAIRSSIAVVAPSNNIEPPTAAEESALRGGALAFETTGSAKAPKAPPPRGLSYRSTSTAKAKPKSNGVADAVGEIVDGVYHGRPFPTLVETGPIERWPVALLLSTIRYDRGTGMLDMNNESGTHRRIYIIDGKPTFMQSNAEGENVGSLLLSRGRITEPDFERCLRYMKDKGRTLQQSLLDMRLVTEADLATAYKLLAGQLLPLALKMASGAFRWRSTDAFVGRVPEGRFEPVQMLFEGIQKHVHPPQILKFFSGREDVPLVPTSEFSALLSSFQRVFGRQTVASDIDGDRTYRQLTRMHAASTATSIPQLFALVTSGMTVLPEVTDENALEVAVNAAAAQAEGLGIGGGLSFELNPGLSGIDPKAQAMVERYHAEIMSLDFFQILHATPETDEDAIKSAYFDLAKRWHTDAFVDRNLGGSQQKLEEIFGRITEAYETITDPAKRSDYITYLDRKAKGLSTDIDDILRGEQLFDQATAMINRQDWANARQVLKEATRLNPDPTYFATLGWVIFSQDPASAENLTQAMKLLRKAVQDQERLPIAYQYLGSIAYARGNDAEAKKWWQRCVQWEPGNAEAIRGLRALSGPAAPQPSGAHEPVSRRPKN